ncbi:hypothetical protein MMF93_21815 [Streptomyces tubbatahanensis]|uniref:Lipoprotein n=1 Tax=Streptomyces tubbatahanensis TaxID=2923272 RepID=A0ABY3XWM6_9ACTN|nr:hypothetical protein [Streptomyces tubbatahanensis]UNS98807.1 hypothetical protein MMF93_21815 [Streptomyces tubbatahanensis]
MPGRARAPRSAALLALVSAGTVTALSGCADEDPDAGTNGVGKLSATRIEKKARSAAEGAEAVRVDGSVVSKGQTYRLKMRLKKSGGVGEVSAEGGSTFELLRTDRDLYLKAGTDFWAQQEGGKKPDKSDVTAAQKLKGKYVKVPRKDPAYKQLSVFTDMSTLLDGLLAMEGKRTTGERGEVDGTKTIRVTAGEGSGGTIDVSLKGRPYPLRLQRPGGAGTVRLTDWNDGFALQAPKKDQTVDYGKRISPEQKG